jgi:hypothetical protein
MMEWIIYVGIFVGSMCGTILGRFLLDWWENK